MCEALLVSKTAWSSKMCALTWKEKVTKSGRSIFQITGVGAPHKRERVWIVANSRRTLRQGSELEGENADESKQENADQYQRSSSTSTDNVADTHTRLSNGSVEEVQSGRQTLTLAVKEQMWPTPTVNDSKNNAGPSQFKRKGTNLNVAVAKRGTQGGSLNPTWVEWLMGYPAGYTDLKALGNSIVPKIAEEIGRAIAIAEKKV